MSTPCAKSPIVDRHLPPAEQRCLLLNPWSIPSRPYEYIRGARAPYSADLLVYTSRSVIRPLSQFTQTVNLTAPSPLGSSDFRRVAEGLSTSPTTPRQS
ncbi:hypothetical protein B0H13DRAFT_2335370 [Mycena leptocephala]|nr:hypothetical protein B0H13DRAFT_2335370 [Mycena leptocephala]